MDIAREVAAVVFVLALLGGALWALRRGISFKGPARARRIEIVERVALTPQHALHLVRFGDEELVVSTHPQGCALLDRKPVDAGADVARASACSAGIRAGVSAGAPR